MKNIIPLVVSVILGLAAVYIVSKLLFEKEKADTENKISVVVAARDLEAHDELSQGALTYKDVPQSAVPKNALLWENVGLAYGQELPHAVSQDDYILMTDIRIQTTLSDCARPGEWTPGNIFRSCPCKDADAGRRNCHYFHLCFPPCCCQREYDGKRRLRS